MLFCPLVPSAGWIPSEGLAVGPVVFWCWSSQERAHTLCVLACDGVSSQAFASNQGKGTAVGHLGSTAKGKSGHNHGGSTLAHPLWHTLTSPKNKHMDPETGKALFLQVEKSITIPRAPYLLRSGAWHCIRVDSLLSTRYACKQVGASSKTQLSSKPPKYKKGPTPKMEDRAGGSSSSQLKKG